MPGTPRRRRRFHATAVVLSATVIALAVTVRAHKDDAKLLDRQPPHAGSAWRANAPIAAPLVAEFPREGVRLLSWLPLGEFEGDPVSASDCWGYVSPGGREYAILGISTGTAFVDVTVPADAQVVGFVPGVDSFFRDIKTYQTHAYIVSEDGGGVQVVDLSQIDAGEVTLVNTVDDMGTSSTHNVAIDEESGFLYRLGGGDNGLRIYSLADCASPAYEASWTHRYVHDAQIVTHTSGPLAGRQIAYCCSGFNEGFTDTGVTILDVTAKDAILQLAQREYPDRKYSHQAWLSSDGRYLFHGDELDEGNTVSNTVTRVFDVSDPARTTLAGTFTNGNTASGHNLYVHGDRLFEANFRSGLRVFDVSDPLDPEEIAWFDTYPQNDEPRFNGMWSTYPFFPSGTVIGSDIEKGLFVWRLGEPLALSFVGEPPVAVDPTGESVQVSIAEGEGARLVPGSAMLHVDTGAGFVSVELVDTGGSVFEGVFPGSSCGDVIRYYVSADADDGTHVELPPGGESNAELALSAVFFDTAFADNMEIVAGWTAGDPGDTATQGAWLRADPRGTVAQPEDDHTADPGRHCFLTGQHALGGGPEDDDVDGGHTTLTSPAFDMTGMTLPRILYWRWLSNDQGAAPSEDVLVVEISADDGATWTEVETVGPAGAEAGGGWFPNVFDPAALVPLSDRMRVRFVASDEGEESLVEAAVDDFHAFDARCEGDIPILLCGNGAVNAGCGDPTDALTVNGSTGEDDRTVQVTLDEALSFVLAEAPAQHGDERTSRAVVYLWATEPDEDDIVPLPANLGPMCFGPLLVRTREPRFTWNSVGAENRLGEHDAPTPPPLVPDGGSLELLQVAGAGRALRLTVQGILQDDCTQGNKPFSVTNAVLVDVTE